MTDTLITVESVSKKFCRKLKRSLWYGVKDLGSELIGRNNGHKALRKDEFWAVKGVSFELKRGECLGLIGKNGAGKSTLLKMLNGIIKPDEGLITMRGRVGALIELGAGFNPILTGRENIYNNAAVLGITKRRVDRILDEIIDFAEIDEFIDTPVQNYSSGMRVRLGFAVAAHLEPDVLIIDEVLAVGDVGFRAKCYNVISKISKNASIILVSHQMPQVARICTDICAINYGKTVYKGKDVPRGIDRYYDSFKSAKGIVTGSGRATINKIDFESNGKKNIRQISYMEALSVHLNISVDPNVKHPVVGITFLSRELHMVAQCVSSHNDIQLNNCGEPLDITLEFSTMNLNPGLYMVSAFVYDDNRQEILAQHFAIKELQISGNFVGSAPVQFVGKWNVNRETEYTGQNRPRVTME